LAEFLINSKNNSNLKNNLYVNMASIVGGDFISPYEAEHLIGELKDIDLKEYGSK